MSIRDLVFSASGACTGGAKLDAGTLWVKRDSGTTNEFKGCAYGNGIYVACGVSGTLLSSTDGLNWTTRTSNFSTNNVYAVAYGNGLFVIVGSGGKLATSPDGITWTLRTSQFGTAQISGVTYGTGLFVIVGVNGTLATSADGITWTLRTSQFGTSAIYGVSYCSGLFIACGGSGKLATSADGITWTLRTSQFGASTVYNASYGNGIYVIVGDTGKLATSPDGITWTLRTSQFGTSAIYNVAFGNGLFVAIGRIGTLTTSPDGITWVLKSSGSSSNLLGITYGDKFVTVGDGGTLLTSQQQGLPIFATSLYTGNGATQTITNYVDLATKGGLVWIKSRSASANNVLVDTARGSYASLSSNLTSQSRGANTVIDFGSTGFTVTNDTSDATFQNTTGVNGTTYASWTFQEQPKFFDIVTYTGNGVAGRQIPHNLGGEVGMMIVKSKSATGSWNVYNRNIGNTNYMQLNATIASSVGNLWNNTTPTDSVFTLSDNVNVNSNGQTYVAYLFAHDPSGVIQCGSFTTDASGNATVTLGWKPQWLLVKASSASDNWYMLDTVREWAQSSANDQFLKANLNDAENIAQFGYPTSTGFNISVGAGNQTYIYMAIKEDANLPYC